jgi:hypothetical protein
MSGERHSIICLFIQTMMMGIIAHGDIAAADRKCDMKIVRQRSAS